MKKVMWVILFGLITISVAEMDAKETFGRRVYNMEGDSTKSETLGAKIYGIYFSAHWCPPCRSFSPVLVDTYNQIKKNGGEFEILFVSSDRSEDAMFEYMEELKMPWLAVDHKSSEADDLKEKYEVRGIPKLVIIDASGKLITADGRKDVQTLGSKAWKKWTTE